MFVNSGQLPHLLTPEAYFDQGWYDREQKAIFADVWHPICRTADVPQHGDRFAGMVNAVPVVIVNRNGSLFALENICAHRHSEIVSCGKSKGEQLRCQIHGWEYDEAGRLAHLPDGRSFVGIKAQDYCLKTYAVESAGPFVFVNLCSSPSPLELQFGAFAPEFHRYYDNLRPIFAITQEHPVNWKIVCENSVESYHVPLVHKESFADHRLEELHDHRLEPEFSRYGDLMPFEAEQKWTAYAFRFYIWLLIQNPSYARFTHVHLYPNMLLYFLDFYADVRIVVPLGPERCRITTWGFVPRTVHGGLLGRWLQDLSMLVFERMVRKIADEDITHWPPVQEGLKHSRHRGILSAREERVHAFQKYVIGRMDQATDAGAAGRCSAELTGL